jgi:hypothetical protein
MTPFIWFVATSLAFPSGAPPRLSYYCPHMGSLIHDFSQRASPAPTADSQRGSEFFSPFRPSMFTTLLALAIVPF